MNSLRLRLLVGGAAAVIDKHMHSELARLRKVIKEAGIRRE